MYDVEYNKQADGKAIEYPFANPGKNPVIAVGDKKYIRHAIKTHYVEVGKDNYIDIVNK